MPELRAALDAPPGGLDRAPAARRQARPAGARGADAEAQRGGEVHARRLGLPRRLGRRRRRRRARPASAPARCASWPRRPGSSCRPSEELVLFSRWITPEVIATRFDAWFFLALAPAHTPPQADGVETTEARWFEPARGARGARSAGELVLSFPTSDAAALAGRVPHLRRGDRRLPRAHDRADPAEGDRRRRRRTARRPPRRPRLPRLSARRPGTAPGRRARGRAGRCGCRSRPSPPCSRLNSWPAFFSAALQLRLAALAQPPEEPELAVVDAEVDLAGHRRHPAEEAGAEQLAQRHRVVLASAPSPGSAC